MGRIWMPGCGGGGATSDELTATKAHVLEGHTAVTSDSNDEAATGTMLGRNTVGKNSAIGMNSAYPNVALSIGDGNQITNALDGKVYLASRPPAGWYNGQAFVGMPQADAAWIGGLTADKLAYNQTAFGLTGAYKGLGNASPGDVRAGKWFSTAVLSDVEGTIEDMAGQTVNPGTSAKTVSCSNKYMTGNITVPAISIPAAYIKKNQTITFPDGSSVTGTFEGYPSGQTDIYNCTISANSGNVDGFSLIANTGISGGSLWWNTDGTIMAANDYDLSRYDKLRVYTNVDSSYDYLNFSFGIYEVSSPSGSRRYTTLWSGRVWPTTSPNLTYRTIELNDYHPVGKPYITGSPGLQVKYWCFVKD